MWIILDNSSCTHEKNVDYFVMWTVLCMSVDTSGLLTSILLFIWFSVWTIYPLNARGISISYNYCIAVSPFSSGSICFVHLGVLLLGTYLIVSSNQTDPLLFVMTLSLIESFGRKSIMCNSNTTIPILLTSCQTSFPTY